ncbi:MAG: uroporphyrinogen-III synthase [bacterium]|nr:uroporphyrinogen-III synthase [bacterium]
MPRLAVTRYPAQLAELAIHAAAKGIEVVPLPLISVQEIPFDWPEGLEISKIDWVFFSSANGVSAFLHRLDELGLRMPPTTRYAVVGSKTADALALNGLKVGFLPSDSYGELLFEEFAGRELRAGQTLLYARAREVNYDPSKLFAGRPVAYYAICCYETIAQPVTADAVARLTENDFILFTAPSTVDSYAQQYGMPVARPIAIGRSTASQMNQYGWFGFITMKHADITTILEYL